MTPTAELIWAARRTVAQHRRRRHPDARVCGFCLWAWKEERTPAGRPARGCPQRRQALNVLDAAGQLDELGRPLPPEEFG